MRLTLRTLLAYMDGVLESEDSEELAQKIEESEYATEIVHRTRDVVRRLRLGAPPIEPRGKGLDANSVAEYLDNTLSPERVSDFEALCLDTDIHLAEVAGSHQILTYVLGAPAEVDAACRQRIYGLLEDGNETGAGANKALKAPAAAATAPKTNGVGGYEEDERPTRRKEPLEVPDYLRDPPPAPKTGRFIAVGLLLVVAGAIVIGMQPNWLPGFLKFGDANNFAQNDNQNGANAVGNSGDAAGDQSTADPNAANQDAGDLRQPDGANQLGNPDQNNATNENPDNGANAAMPPLPDQDDPNDARNGDGGELAAPPAGDVTGDANSGANDITDDATTNNDEAGNVVEPGLPGDSASPVIPQQVAGQLTSTDSVLLRFGGSPPSLSRLPQRGDVSTGEPLISLPDYRNVITLADGLTVQAVGEVHFEFEVTGSEMELPRIHLKQGRILVSTVGVVGTRMRLRNGDLEYALTFQEPGSTLAIEARRVRAEDVVPHESVCPTELKVDCVAGKAVWESFARGGRNDLSAGMRWAQSAIPSEPIVVTVDTPEWATSMNLPPLAARGAQQIEQYLRGQMAVRVRQALLEQATSNRVEVSSLAIRCLAAADDFDSAIDTLSNPDFRAFWNEHIQSLQRATVRSPESASLVQIALDSRRGDYAAELYRMLWGYTAGELQQGGHAAKLIEYLMHDDLDFRVVASGNLREITGITDIIYRPDGSQNTRKRAMRLWMRRLDDGKVVPKSNN